MSRSGTLAAIGIGAFLAVALVCGGLGVGFLFLVREQLQHHLPRDTSEIAYTLTGPTALELGETATLVVLVTNNSATEHRMLHSLDLYTELLGQSAAVAKPAAASTYFSESYGQLQYGLPLPPGATERIEVQFTPTVPGQYNINIDACIDNELSFIERFHWMNVTEAVASDGS